MHGGLQVSNLLSESVVFSCFHFKLVFNILETFLLHCELSIQVEVISIPLLKHFLDPVNFHLSDVNLVLVLLDLKLGFLMYFLLGCGYTIKLCTHVLNLPGLSALDISSTLNLFVAFLDFNLS